MCPAGHSFDVARQGYVNLLRRGRRRAAGDSAEMVAARAAFLASGAYDRISDHLNQVCARELAGLDPGFGAIALDAGCGEGFYTRRLAASLDVEAVIAGVDISRPAVAAAARRHPDGYYAVASVFDLPLPPASVDLIVSVFGPVDAQAFARVLRPGGSVVAVHPGPGHLYSLREAVYERPEPHEVKDPLRNAPDQFAKKGTVVVGYPLRIEEPELARQLLTMTPYRWHAPRDIGDVLEQRGAFETDVDVVISSYRNRAGQGP
jgi:23S rRNA (guanine745-N1)-methyltransferase